MLLSGAREKLMLVLFVYLYDVSVVIYTTYPSPVALKPSEVHIILHPLCIFCFNLQLEASKHCEKFWLGVFLVKWKGKVVKK